MLRETRWHDSGRLLLFVTRGARFWIILQKMRTRYWALIREIYRNVVQGVLFQSFRDSFRIDGQWKEHFEWKLTYTERNAIRGRRHGRCMEWQDFKINPVSLCFLFSSRNFIIIIIIFFTTFVPSCLLFISVLWKRMNLTRGLS